MSCWHKDIIKFPKQIKSLPPEDYRLNLIYQIIQKLFHEITFFLFNILICQHEVTQNYVIFFSDAESVPFSKCCNSPVYVELYESGTGRIMCNEKTCQMHLLTEFIINFEEGQNLWKENLVFTTSAQQDTLVRRTVSKFITTGYFKHKSIVKEVKKLQKSVTSKPKQINDFYPLSTNNQDHFSQSKDQFYQNPFLTAQEEGFQSYYNQKPYGGQSLMNPPPEFQDLQFQTNDQNYYGQTQSRSNIPAKTIPPININKEENLPFTRLKIDQGELISMNQKIASGLVQNSQVFNKEFKLNNKIGNNSTQNKWRPQSMVNVDGGDYQFRNTLSTHAPNIRLKSGFNKEKRNKSSNAKYGRTVKITRRRKNAPGHKKYDQ